uniref:Polycomb group ring finger 1 n=1 Tax=Chrysemys picta bellii TaxID=8478 RepID=A0A8C3PDM8_CHRPI
RLLLRGGPMAIAMRLRNQLQAVYKMDPLRNEVRVGSQALLLCCAGDGGRGLVCKSCIVKYLQTSKYCPMCNTKIHETQPLLNLKLDRVMQDVVYKLVPGLQESEWGEGCRAPLGDPVVDTMGLPYSSFDHSRAHYYRYDEHVSLCLERQSSSKEKNKTSLQQKFVRCSVRAQVRHLRRVLCHRLGLALQHVSEPHGLERLSGWAPWVPLQ